MTDAVLVTRDLHKQFGGIVAADKVSISIAPGDRHALIGPNGAGKTTLVNLLTGVLKPTSGSIRLDGDDITAMSVERRVRRGLVRTFQISQLFPELTPLQTLCIALTERGGRGWQVWLPLGRQRAVVNEAVRLLEQFHLGDVMHQRTAHIAYGKRRALEIVLALAARPRVLLLDEPVAGVPEGEREEILRLMANLPDEVAILLIEHDMELVFSFARRMTVMVNGAIFIQGTPQEIAANEHLKAIYLGEGEIRGQAHG